MSTPLARLLVFISSAAVLVIEILAVRLMAPYLGVSLEVFTGVIGVILAGIAAGAWVGGRAADRIDPAALVGPVLVFGGLTAMASPLIVDVLGRSASTGPASIVTLTVVGFFLPAAVLSAIPPLIVKMQLSSLDSTGTVVGSFSAVGTFGALFGTFITGFFLIAAFPTRPIVAALGLILVSVGVLTWVSKQRWMMAILVFGAVGLSAMLFAVAGPCQFETAYHCGWIEVDDNPSSGRTLILDRLSNSYVDLDDPEHIQFRYLKTVVDIINTHADAGPLTVVAVGGGGFTLPGYVSATRQGSTNIVLEIDPGLVEIGRNHLALRDDVDVRIADARQSIRDIADDSADVVVGDAFSGYSVPWHLTTVEFLTEISRVLTDQGLYAMNVIDFDNLRFVRSAAATLSELFENVVVFAPSSAFVNGRGGNFVLAGSDQDFDLGSIRESMETRNGVEQVLDGQTLIDFIGDAPILTDDYAPVDQMLGNR